MSGDRSGGVSPLHEKLVRDQVLTMKVRTDVIACGKNKFWQAVIKHVGRHLYMPEYDRYRKMRPDAWCIYKCPSYNLPVIQAIEVEVTNPISDRLEGFYHWLYLAFDSDDIHFHVTAIDRFGRHREVV